jgi:sigma-B regulation protein RsbU (phosphoserine phosphatase)
MLLNLTDLSTEPLHKQIVDRLADLIIDGELTAGTELPPARAFAREQHVSKSTVERAYTELAKQGLLRRNRSRRPTVPTLSREDRHVISLTRHNGRHSLFNAIESFSRELISAFDTGMICKTAEEALRRFVQARSIYLGLYDDLEDALDVSIPGGDQDTFRIQGDDPFWQEIRQAEVLTLVTGVETEDRTSLLLEELNTRGVRIVFMLRETDRVLGLIALGSKRDGSDYATEDLHVLRVLANQFTTALVTARLYVESLEKRRMDEELRIAHEIQVNLLPEEPQEQDGLSIWASTTPSHTVGGDFYDYFIIDGSRLGFVIADACGHGMPAAILISQIQAIVRSEVGNGNTVSRTIRALNRQLHRQAGSGFFATLFYGVIDRSAAMLEYVNAGHDFPFLVRRNGEIVALKSTGPALGVLPEADHEVESISVGEGDCILLYTDGITETTSCAGRQYGESRLRDLLIGNRHSSPREIVRVITKDLEWFTGTCKQQDDRTLLALRIDQLVEGQSDAA